MKKVLASILGLLLFSLSVVYSEVNIKNGSTVRVNGNDFTFPASAGPLSINSGTTYLDHKSCSGGCTDIRFTTGFSNTYKAYRVVIVQAVPTNSNETLHLQCSTDGGSTYDSSGVYYWTNMTARNSGVTSTGGTSAVTEVDFNQTASGYYIGNSLYGYNGEFMMYRSVDNPRPRFNYSGTYFDPTNSFLAYATGSGFYGNNAGTNAIRLYFTSTMASGEFYLYGLTTP